MKIQSASLRNSSSAHSRARETDNAEQNKESKKRYRRCAKQDRE